MGWVEQEDDLRVIGAGDTVAHEDTDLPDAILVGGERLRSRYRRYQPSCHRSIHHHSEGISRRCEAVVHMRQLCH